MKTLGNSTSFKCTNPCPSTNKHPNQTLKTLFKVIALKIPGGQAPNLRPERADAASRLRSLSERQGSLMQLLQHMKEKQPNKCVKQNSMLKCSMSMVSLSTLGSRLWDGSHHLLVPAKWTVIRHVNKKHQKNSWHSWASKTSGTLIRQIVSCLIDFLEVARS